MWWLLCFLYINGSRCFYRWFFVIRLSVLLFKGICMKSLYVSRRGKSWEESCSLMYPCSFPIRIINMTHHDPDPAPSSEEFTNYAWVEDCGLADLRGKLGVSSDLRNLPSFWGHAGAFIKSFFTIDDVTTFWISLRILIQQLQLIVLRFFWMMWDDNLN